MTNITLDRTYLDEKNLFLCYSLHYFHASSQPLLHWTEPTWMKNSVPLSFPPLFPHLPIDLYCTSQSAYCPFDTTPKGTFCLAFYFERKYFVLIDHILSETICLFCFCILFSNMHPKIKFMAKNWSDLCNSSSKVAFHLR